MMILYDLEKEENIIQADIHAHEILNFTVTYDHTMLITCSKDGLAKMLNPKTF
jgi:WD40 repeat protein